MPGAFTSTRARRSAWIGPLPSIGIAQGVDDAAEQFLADRHVHDGAGALHGLAFADLAVGAEDHDADVIGLEVQGHASDTGLELDHLARLDVIEPIDASNAVADRQDLTDFRDFGFVAEVLDLPFQDIGNFSGADIHQPTSFMRVRMELSLVFSDPSTMRLPSRTIEAAEDFGVDLDVEFDGLAAGRLDQRLLQALEMSVAQAARRRSRGRATRRGRHRRAHGTSRSCRRQRTGAASTRRGGGTSPRARPSPPPRAPCRGRASGPRH